MSAPELSNSRVKIKSWWCEGERGTWHQSLQNVGHSFKDIHITTFLKYIYTNRLKFQTLDKVHLVPKPGLPR